MLSSWAGGFSPCSSLFSSWSGSFSFCPGSFASTIPSFSTTSTFVINPFSSKSTSICGTISIDWYLGAGFSSVIVYLTLVLNPLLSKCAVPIPFDAVTTDSSFVFIVDSTLYVVPANFIVLSTLSMFSISNCTSG